ncbi:hypothetical protein P8452_48806 [Trifolium repens]|nr:hypothetical protein P8452_48806 [Trifolium repens]
MRGISILFLPLLRETWSKEVWEKLKKLKILTFSINFFFCDQINKVQHLIETCLTFHMTKEECMDALSKRAYIDPIIASTVWNELEKENKEFFESYIKSKSGNEKMMSQEETTQMLQEMISSSDSSKDEQVTDKGKGKEV